MFASKAGAYPSEGSWPYPQTLNKAGKACRDKHSSFFVNYSCKKGFMALVPWCILIFQWMLIQNNQ
jgi:hypothetical protein